MVVHKTAEPDKCSLDLAASAPRFCQVILDTPSVRDYLTAMSLKLTRRRLRCSFCKKPEAEVAKLLGGQGVTICDSCIAICNKILDAVPSSFAGWDSMADAQLLQSLKPSEAAVEGMRKTLQEQVETLRSRGISWADIGGALGISRQAAWERFS
jgi:hypothetical protein